MSSDEAVKETHAVANFEESAEPAVLSAELERAVTLDFNPIMTPNPKQDSTRTMVLRTSEPLTQEQQFAQPSHCFVRVCVCVGGDAAR